MNAHGTASAPTFAVLTFLQSAANAQEALSRPDAPFQGVANRTLTGSKPDFPPPVAAPEGAPNVRLILVDDAGFGNPSTIVGPCRTPTLTRLAEEGLRYNRFHVTALCWPTRAALLSGRNHHAVGPPLWFMRFLRFCWPAIGSVIR
jgi:arylsulfatase